MTITTCHKTWTMIIQHSGFFFCGEKNRNGRVNPPNEFENKKWPATVDSSLLMTFFQITKAPAYNCTPPPEIDYRKNGQELGSSRGEAMPFKAPNAVSARESKLRKKTLDWDNWMSIDSFSRREASSRWKARLFAWRRNNSGSHYAT